MAGKLGKAAKWIMIPGVLYLMSVTPRVVNRPDAGIFRKKYFAHRGLHDNAGEAPENSMAAFRRAVEAGYGIELDVQMTKDGIPVIFHDGTLERMCGVKARIEDYTYEQLQQFKLADSEQSIPKLEDMLALVDGRVPLIVEIKSETKEVTFCAVIDRMLRAYQGEYCIESFNPLAVFWYRRHRKNIVRGQLSDAFIKEGEYVGTMSFLLQNLMFNWVGRPDFIAYNCKYPRMLSARLCRRLYRSKTAAWTVRSREQLAEARKNFDIFIFDSFVPKGKADAEILRVVKECEMIY